jgi:hypothetical protein
LLPLFSQIIVNFDSLIRYAKGIREGVRVGEEARQRETNAVLCLPAPENIDSSIHGQSLLLKRLDTKPVVISSFVPTGFDEGGFYAHQRRHHRDSGRQEERCD